MWKETLIFIGGAVTGAAACYFVTKKKIEDEANRRVDEELAATKAYYAALDYGNLSEEEVAYLNNDREEVEKAYSEIAGAYDYNAVSRPKKAAESATVPEYKIEILDPNSEDPEQLLFEQQTLQYYEGDHVLTDINEIIIPDIEATIGPDALDHFGEFGEEDIVRVRNTRLGIDYEVIRIHGSYVDFN